MNSLLGLPLMGLPRNSTSSQPFVQLPANLLEVFIPGYSTISRLLLETFGFDITLIVSISFFIFALIKSVTFLKTQFMYLVMRIGTCVIQISSDVDTYFWVTEWLERHGIGADSHRLNALQPSPFIQDVGPSDNEIITRWNINPIHAMTPPSYNQNERKFPRYEPQLGLFKYFWYNGNLFIWHQQRERRPMPGHPFEVPTNIIQGSLSCLSRTTAPIKALIEDASAEYFKTGTSRTIAARRPSRPLETVVLKSKQKQHLISDIREYLEPSSQTWYAERGIPYRRGYLFHGAPGTGKSSLAFAVAGFFGLDVYYMSLAEPTIGEEDLVELFGQLPVHCLVLLEDIDSAGLAARDTQASNQAVSMDGARPDYSNMPGAHISLSGLLNVIDGVASQEGRLLIMTTNHVDNLDSALLRPGRVDYRVHFDMAAAVHAENMFLQVFSDESKIKTTDKQPENAQASLNQMAREFSACIPEGVLSPAEIQGFLLQWKGRPEDALANAKEWASGCITSRN
ncbi:P-loop containing nucleoside triphosphate hydrolase protein [Bisporella sp. PMI_857]|nr:P-loop containing nucleoside triphosphate hydrolase protein [Bisporella sp. PMI_857]